MSACWREQLCRLFICCDLYWVGLSERSDRGVGVAGKHDDDCAALNKAGVARQVDLAAAGERTSRKPSCIQSVFPMSILIFFARGVVGFLLPRYCDLLSADAATGRWQASALVYTGLLLRSSGGLGWHCAPRNH